MYNFFKVYLLSILQGFLLSVLLWMITCWSFWWQNLCYLYDTLINITVGVLALQQLFLFLFCSPGPDPTVKLSICNTPWLWAQNPSDRPLHCGGTGPEAPFHVKLPLTSVEVQLFQWEFAFIVPGFDPVCCLVFFGKKKK